MMMHAGHVCFTVADFHTVEMKDQQIQTETVEPVKPHVQAGSTTEPQGVYTTVHVNDTTTRALYFLGSKFSLYPHVNNK